ncbi:MAG: hypothetical protein KC994_16320, partial [Candidatus Omnitrophica bacterium]|nr:hypothetical protein [Candidatus Omnitrophota bacterium]
MSSLTSPLRYLVPQILLFGMLSNSIQSMPVESWITSLDMSRKLSKGEPLAFGDPEVGETIDIRVDPEKTHQTILGLGSSFEHTTCWNLWRLSPEKRSEVLDRLV